jgi:adenylate cyclase
MWALAVLGLLLPLAGLAALVGNPGIDGLWEHHPAHFWIVLGAGVLAVALSYVMGSAAARRRDGRLLLLSLAFLAAAGFLGLHALATPGVLLDAPNAGFTLAMPVGLVVAACLAAASTLPLDGIRGAGAIPWTRWVQAALVVVLVAWGIVSLAEVPPLGDASIPERSSGPLLVLAGAGVALYVVAAWRYLALYRVRRGMLALVVVSALVLLAEALVATAVSRSWHASWWEWHVLFLGAFALVAYAAHRQWHEERFSDLYLDGTSAGVREMTVLFADLKGFTSFSEQHDPDEVSTMLNAYFSVAIPPIVRRHDGAIDRIIGDALMATFGPHGGREDHALRAARAGLDLQRATAEIADAHPGWPRFRVGINTGPASLGVLGAAGGRTYSAIGDAVNVAARLEGIAPVGGVSLGGETARRLPDAQTESLGLVSVKGREAPVEAFLLVDLGLVADEDPALR